MLASKGIKTSYLRMRALPTTREQREFTGRYQRVYVVENNLDGQMRRILLSEEPEHATRFRSISKCDGLPLTGRWIAQSILEQE